MKFIDLFAGAGGLSCGLEQAGFAPVFANEIEPVFAGTYQANHPDTLVASRDVRELDADFLQKLLGESGGIDLIAGGPPCQGYSIIAPERSNADPRNHLFREFLRIVEFIRPRAVLIENVPGIIFFENGQAVKAIYESLASLGYKVGHKILCAAHYGVPQMRFRTFFIAVYGYTGDIQFPFPTHKAKVRQNFSDAKRLCFNPGPLLELNMRPQTGGMDAIGDLPPISDGVSNDIHEYKADAASPFQEYARAGSGHITSHFCARLSDINRERLKYIPQGGSWRDIPYDLLPQGLKRANRSDHTKRYGRLDPAGLCSTIQTKCDPHWGCFFHPEQDRVISVREAARLQSFPDRIQFMGDMTQQYKQVGNAVPPLPARAVGECIREMLDG